MNSEKGKEHAAPGARLGALTALWALPQMEGMLENWIWQLASALKSQLAQPVNVALANWITLAQNHYAIAVRNTRLVGQEVAALLRWLEVGPAQPPLLALPPRPGELPWCQQQPRRRTASAKPAGTGRPGRDPGPGLSQLPHWHPSFVESSCPPTLSTSPFRFPPGTC